MFLLFHGIQGLEPIVYAVGFFGLIVAPCLAAIGLYRMYSGRVSDNAFRKSLYSIGIFTVVSFAIYASFTFFVSQFEDHPKIHYIFYCLSVPFGFALSIVTVVKTDSTLLAVVAGAVLNVTAMIGFVSLFSDRKRNIL